MDQDVEMPASVSSLIIFGFPHGGGFQDKAAELAEEWICMTSPDGFTFLVKGKVAVVSGTLRNSLTSGCPSHNCTHSHFWKQIRAVRRSWRISD